MTYQTKHGKVAEQMQEAVISDLFGSQLRAGEISTDIAKRQIDCCKMIVANWGLGDKNQFVLQVIETVLSRYDNALHRPTERQVAVISEWLCKYAQLPIMEVLLEAQTARDKMTETERLSAAYNNDPIRLAEIVMSLRKEIDTLNQHLHYYSDREVYKREQAGKHNDKPNPNKHPLFR